MRIRLGYELAFDCPQPLPMITMLRVHASRVPDLLRPDEMVTVPPVPVVHYWDSFGNLCGRLVAPPGGIRLTADTVINDSGQPDPVFPAARQHPVEELPAETLQFLLGSRYCDTERLQQFAWDTFGHVEGWARVQAICDFVYQHVRFGYEYARNTRTAWETYTEQIGVCRDFAHLAVTLCRCTNIPARYCTGYLGDIGVPPNPAPMDFSAWFEAYLEDGWRTFDARHNQPRIGRVPLAYGRDAADVAITSTFGPNTLTGFRVWTEEVPAGE